MVAMAVLVVGAALAAQVRAAMVAQQSASPLRQRRFPIWLACSLPQATPVQMVMRARPPAIQADRPAHPASRKTV